ncbi:MAG: hypothetical protein DHS20C03_03880 [Minwuia thermotolerans]|nr:MAG: hypothetical protein DHS20C03_03880 [Minwuia thermotolerans]
MEEMEYSIERRKLRQGWFGIAISVLTPIILVYLSLSVSLLLQDRDAKLSIDAQILKQKQSLYREIGANINVIFVYLVDIGDYRKFTPDEIVDRKRSTDRIFFSYRPYWSEKTENSYKDFMNAAFKTYSGTGQKAKIRATTDEKKAAFKIDGIAWKEQWDSAFTDKLKVDVNALYYDLVSAFLSDTVSPAIRELSKS